MKARYGSLQPVACVVVVLAAQSAFADESVWSSGAWFGDSGCGRWSVPPSEFFARLNAKSWVTVSASTEPDGSKRVEFRRGADVYRFWNNIADCRAEVGAKTPDN